MKLTHLRELNSPVQKLEDGDRTDFLYTFSNVRVTGRSLYYPNCLLQDKYRLINPYDERVMSLKKDSFYDNNEWLDAKPFEESLQVEETPMFFFVYNVDNYFHFLYDTLPYLAWVSQKIQNGNSLTLLLNTSGPGKRVLPPFVKETLQILGIQGYRFVQPNTLYRTLYVGTSFTHGHQSNESPSRYARAIWERLTQIPISRFPMTPKRFYVSRRSWVHNDTSNMGTNYTERRKCLNENHVVAMLQKYGVEEVFLELLSMEEKAVYFTNAELVVGVIGGGMCNLLLSPTTTKALCIPTPFFREINKRFEFSMVHTKLGYSECATHPPWPHTFRLYSRVRVITKDSEYTNCIGEVVDVSETLYTVSLSNNDVAGFSQDFTFQKMLFREADLEAVDEGLNSPYICDIDILERDLKKLLEDV
jgi:hypothetical protein